MAESRLIERPRRIEVQEVVTPVRASAARRAFFVLQAGFVAVPNLAGLDKFLHHDDIALRDLGLLLGAVALGLLARDHDRPLFAFPKSRDRARA